MFQKLKITVIVTCIRLKPNYLKVGMVYKCNKETEIFNMMFLTKIQTQTKKKLINSNKKETSNLYKKI